MNFDNLINQIFAKFHNANFEHHSSTLKKILSTGGSSTEIIFIVGKYLIDLEKNDINAHSLIKNEVIEYKNLCKKIGIDLDI